jgi:nitroimidazol reductase NimA-like FMN-containing flavoprotein (pyridoxamine 5'-phosphate oxidase superfamily)
LVLPALDRNGLETLDRAECLRLLGAHCFGRIGLSLGALPTVLPVTYKLVGEKVVFRTGIGQKLAAATSGAVVAFEVDDMDVMSRTGWSVVVTGVAREIVDLTELEEFDKSGIPRWIPDGPARTVALSSELIEGRRLNPISPAWTGSVRDDV